MEEVEVIENVENVVDSSVIEELDIVEEYADKFLQRIVEVSKIIEEKQSQANKELAEAAKNCCNFFSKVSVDYYELLDDNQKSLLISGMMCWLTGVPVGNSVVNAINEANVYISNNGYCAFEDSMYYKYVASIANDLI